jgi:hypothetical protein
MATEARLINLPINFPARSTNYFMGGSTNFAQVRFGGESSNFSNDIFISEKQPSAISECVVDREARRIAFRHIDGSTFQFRVVATGRPDTTDAATFAPTT